MVMYGMLKYFAMVLMRFKGSTGPSRYELYHGSREGMLLFGSNSLYLSTDVRAVFPESLPQYIHKSGTILANFKTELVDSGHIQRRRIHDFGRRVRGSGGGGDE